MVAKLGNMATSTCSICGEPVLSRGLCPKHYTRLNRHGDPLATKMPTRGMSLAERLWSRVDRSGRPDTCWPLTGNSHHTFGYAFIAVCGHHLQVTPPVAWM